jgi:hypothetical protein
MLHLTVESAFRNVVRPITGIHKLICVSHYVNGDTTAYLMEIGPV